MATTNSANVPIVAASGAGDHVKGTGAHAHDFDDTGYGSKAEIAVLAAAVNDLNARVKVLEGAPRPEPEPPSAGTTPPAAIDRTGATNVTTALVSWLRGLPAGAVADLDKGTYLIDQLALSGRRDLTVRNGSLKFAKVTTGSNGGAVLLQQNCGGLVFEDLVLTGAATGAPAVAESNHAFQAQGVQGLTIRRVTATGFGGDGVYCGGWVPTTWTHDLVVEDCTFTKCGRMGIGVADGLTNALIQRNTFDVFGWYQTLDIEPNGVTVGSPLQQPHFEDIVFRDNKIGRGNSAKYTFVVSTASLQAPQSSVPVARISVSGNRTIYQDTPWNPIISGWSGAVTMSDNR